MKRMDIDAIRIERAEKALIYARTRGVPKYEPVFVFKKC